MKKVLFLAAALLLVPVAAMAGMTALGNSDMSEVTGQVGITINMSVSVTSGYVAWGDSDGYDATITGPGYLTLSGMSVSNGAGGAMTLNGLTIDAGNDGTDSYLVIGLPTISGDIGFTAVKIGTSEDGGNSLGSVTIGDLSMAGSTIEIKAH